jgi:HAD superfamily hydrolase (TIGR01509 family)
MVRGVIFDIDGTLVDSVDLHAIAWRRALYRFGHRVPYDQVRAQIGKGGDQLLATLIPSASPAERARIEEHRARLFRRWGLPQVRAFPRVRDLFLHARGRGQRIALASSAKASEVPVYERLAAIGDLVDARTTSADAEASKPEPDIFGVALARLGLPAADCAVVGDSPYDAEAAARLGLRAVGVLCGGFHADALRAAGCLELYRDPADLLDRYAASLLAR